MMEVTRVQRLHCGFTQNGLKVSMPGFRSIIWGDLRSPGGIVAVSKNVSIKLSKEELCLLRNSQVRGPPMITYEEFLSTNDIANEYTPLEVIVRLVEDGRSKRISPAVDISPFIHEYFDRRVSDQYAYTILDKSVLTEEFLRRHLEKNSSLFFWLDEAPTFDMPAGWTMNPLISGRISSKKVAKYLEKYMSLVDLVNRTSSEAFCKEWIDRLPLKQIPPKMLTKEMVIRRILASDKPVSFDSIPRQYWKRVAIPCISHIPFHEMKRIPLFDMAQILDAFFATKDFVYDPIVSYFSMELEEETVSMHRAQHPEFFESV